MTATVLITLVGVGMVTGVLSGLIGVGGGVLIVPFLYFLYSHPEWGGFHVVEANHAVIAHATSLFIIVPTVVRGLLEYQRARLVAWRLALPIAAASVLAAAAGARIAVLIPPGTLKLAFGVFVLAAGAQLVSGREFRPPREGGFRAGRLAPVLVGVVVGLFSVMLGLGGGLIAIPLMVHLLGLSLVHVAGTTMFIVLLTAIAGTASYAVVGWGAAGLPPGSAGFVHVLAGLPILLGAVVTVRVGTTLNRQLGGSGLRWVFGTLLVGVGMLLIIQNFPGTG